jgi:hypothetical protein
MDPERLEELARCCEELNAAEVRQEAGTELQIVAGDLRVFERVLEETRTNIAIVSRFYGSASRSSMDDGLIPCPRLYSFSKSTTVSSKPDALPVVSKRFDYGDD